MNSASAQARGALGTHPGLANGDDEDHLGQDTSVPLTTSKLCSWNWL